MKRMFMISWLVLVLLIGCGTTSMIMMVTRPAEVNLKDYKKIAIGDIVDADGSISRHAQDIADDLTTSLFDSETFEVLDRQNLKSIMSEHKLSTTGIIDENTASELGKVIGAAVLVFGRIQTDKYDEETSKGKPWQDKKGGWHQTYYRKGTYSMSVNLKVIDITTSKILAVKSLPAVYVSTKSADNGWPEKIETGVLYGNCLEKITDQFMRMVAPYDVQIKASFQTDKLLPEVSQAITQLKIGEWEEGLALFEEATKKAGLEPKVQAKAFYDLGLAQLYGGDFDNAIINFKQAMKLMPNAKIYQNAITNAKAEKKKAEKLQKQQG